MVFFLTQKIATGRLDIASSDAEDSITLLPGKIGIGFQRCIDEPRGSPFDVLDELRKTHCIGKVYQKVDVIGHSTNRNQIASVILTYFCHVWIDLRFEFFRKQWAPLA